MKELDEIKRKPLTMWDVMSSILKPNIIPTDDEIEKNFNPFIACRYYASNKHSVPIAAVLNRYYNSPLKVQYRFAKDYSDIVGLPKVVKYINFRSQKTPKELKEILEVLEKEYKITEKTAREYLEMMLETEEGQQKLSELTEKHTRREGIA